MTDLKDDLIRRQSAIEEIEFGITYMKAINTQTGEVIEPFAKINDELREAVNRVKALPSAQQWIPCSERLPEDDRTKVVTLANGNSEAGYYSNGDWWCIGDSITLENPTVIAWMPLPKPYEVEE